MNLNATRTCVCALAAVLACLTWAGCQTVPAPLPDPDDGTRNPAPNPDSSTDGTNPMPELPGSTSNDAPPSTDPVPEVIQLPASGQELQQLKQESAIPPFVHFDGKVPSSVEVNVPLPAGETVDAVTGALSYLDKYKNLYRLDEPASQLFLSRYLKDADGSDHLFFGQQRDGIVVHGAELAVHLRAGRLSGTNGHYLPVLPGDTSPYVDAKSAVALAAQSLATTPDKVQGVPMLVYFNPSLLGAPEDVTKLAWRVAMTAGCDRAGGCTSYLVFVDAIEAEVLWTENRDTHCNADFDIETANNSWSTTCWAGPFETENDQWFSETGRYCPLVGSCANPDADGYAANDAAHRVYDYYMNTFQACGWDRSGDATMEALVHVAFNPPNAAYDRGCDLMKFSNGYVTLDIFAHEYTHAITRWSSGLGGAFQPGALNESYSDFFAAMIDGNWTIGEGSAAGILRDATNPPNQGNPDHMIAGATPRGVGYQNLPNTTAGDSGGVHINCDITTRAAYLMVVGGTQAGITVRRMEQAKVAQLYYGVLVYRLTSGSQFIDARNATVGLAREWWRGDAAGRSVFGFGQSDVASVINGFAAVGLGAPDQDNDGYDDVEDADDDGDHIFDATDNCPKVNNPYQEDSDRDGMGDACDGDDDNDGVVDNMDNCPSTANPGQQDRDGDGLGDSCDNCPDYVGRIVRADGQVVTNPDQTDTDHDGQGNLCDGDDDNDGLPDGGDNCPLNYNPDQRDIDRNGIGLSCDRAEQEKFNREAGPTNVTPIGPCTFCGDYFTDKIKSHVNVLLPVGVDARIIDEVGNVVARGKATSIPRIGTNWAFEVNPASAAFYRFPATATKNLGGLELSNNRPFIQAKQYFVQVLPQTAATAGVTAPLNITVQHANGGA